MFNNSKNSVYERIELGFITMKLPVIDDESYRIFDTMEEFHKWVNENIPNWLGCFVLK
ncbi:MAG: hypothetical protein SCARUB_02083 [Candidatus Scalindua rubra]|uniref:Uncharacterized protein n=1 Tax=Candidatus Scalindua rubra TaxID=1872076 RepID=A0A1E3XAZ0_9BACT|nr:MAG: hypothetical protein SCARUB_02083 [Candidatus Scalindua rubra]